MCKCFSEQEEVSYISSMCAVHISVAVIKSYKNSYLTVFKQRIKVPIEILRNTFHVSLTFWHFIHKRQR